MFCVRFVGSAFRGDGPDDACGFVGQGYSCDLWRLAVGKAIKPSRMAFAFSDVAQHTGRAKDEQASQASVAHLRDMSQPLLAATGVWLRR